MTGKYVNLKRSTIFLLIIYDSILFIILCLAGTKLLYPCGSCIREGGA